VERKGVDKIFIVAAEVGDVDDPGGNRLEDRPVPQVVTVLRQVRQPFPAALARGGLIEDVAGDLPGECPWRAEPECGGIEVVKPVVDHSGSERSAQFCERLVMADVGVVAGGGVRESV
jgi:hypothetical protein